MLKCDIRFTDAVSKGHKGKETSGLVQPSLSTCKQGQHRQTFQTSMIEDSVRSCAASLLMAVYTARPFVLVLGVSL
jgi:hypothetical protein